MERLRYLGLVAREVENAIAASKCSPEYIELLRQVLGDPGGILSPSARVRWGSLVLLTCESASYGEWRHAVPAAAALEVFAASLETFDDVEDDDPPPPWFELGKGHLTNVAYGLLMLSQQCVFRLAKRKETADKAMAVADVLSGVGLIAGSGQHYDLLLEGRTDVSKEQCVEIASQKSASLVSGACRVGALLGTENQDLIEQYARFGWHVGMAAQLDNDIEGVRRPGKSDIRRFKPILPLSFYAESLRSDGISPPVGEVDEEKVRRALWDSGAIHYTWVIADVHRQQAEEILDKIEEVRPARFLLGHLVAPEEEVQAVRR
ncbi:MAG: polyprenyl synthetase family protein [Chloroflexi bacterium]|nr:polyprenyl synthetase family protein [Chloroflexota bacterium]